MKYLRIALIIVFIVLVLIIVINFYLPRFLTYEKPVNSDNYLIEAWISAYEIERAAQDFKAGPDARFFISGYNYPEADQQFNKELSQSLGKENPLSYEGIWLLTNSSLYFDLHGLKFNPGDTLVITVNLKGQEAAGYFAFFTLIVNGECIGSDFSRNDFEDYTFHFVVPRDGITTLFVRFTNDYVAGKSDRNLNVRSVRIGDSLILADTNNTGIIGEMNRLSTGFGSQADEAANYLSILGVDPGKITLVRFDPVSRNQTFASARQFSNYINNHPLTGFNIITSDIHSRRTWITYKKILGKQVKTGVIYFDLASVEKKEQFSNLHFYFRVLNEFSSYLVNWIVLTLPALFG